MKFSEAKTQLESQQIRIGIGMILSGKKMSDYGPVFEKDPSDFATTEEYEKAKDEFEKSTREKYEAAKLTEDPKVELIFRQPRLDELMALNKDKKKLPVDLNLNVPEIAKVALEYMGTGEATDIQQIDKTLSILEKCYIGDTFEDKEKRTGKEVIEFIRSSKELSIDVVSQFFEQVGK